MRLYAVHCLATSVLLVKNLNYLFSPDLQPSIAIAILSDTDISIFFSLPLWNYYFSNSKVEQQVQLRHRCSQAET